MAITLYADFEGSFEGESDYIMGVNEYPAGDTIPGFGNVAGCLEYDDTIGKFGLNFDNATYWSAGFTSTTWNPSDKFVDNERGRLLIVFKYTAVNTYGCTLLRFTNNAANGNCYLQVGDNQSSFTFEYLWNNYNSGSSGGTTRLTAGNIYVLEIRWEYDAASASDVFKYKLVDYATASAPSFTSITAGSQTGTPAEADTLFAAGPNAQQEPWQIFKLVISDDPDEDLFKYKNYNPFKKKYPAPPHLGWSPYADYGEGPDYYMQVGLQDDIINEGSVLGVRISTPDIGAGKRILAKKVFAYMQGTTEHTSKGLLMIRGGVDDGKVVGFTRCLTASEFDSSSFNWYGLEFETEVELKPVQQYYVAVGCSNGGGSSLIRGGDTSGDCVNPPPGVECGYPSVGGVGDDFTCTGIVADSYTISGNDSRTVAIYLEYEVVQGSLALPDPKLMMPELLIPNRKPVGPVAINWDDTITDRLAICYLGGHGEGADLCGNPVKYNSAAVVRSNRDGKVDYCAGGNGEAQSNADYVGIGDTVLADSFLGNTPTTFIMRFKFLGAYGAVWPCIFSAGLPGSDNCRIHVSCENTSPYTIWVQTHDSAGWHYFDTVDCNITTDTFYTLIIVYDPDDSGRIYVYLSDGSDENNTIAPSLFPASGTEILLGNGNGTQGSNLFYGHEIEISYFYAFRRLINAAERNRIFNDPYSFLIPR